MVVAMDTSTCNHKTLEQDHTATINRSLNPAAVNDENKSAHKQPQPIEGRCHLYINRKRRYCKTAALPSKMYCVEHSYLLGDSTIRTRIPCPLDAKHSCYEDQLTRHLKRCNAGESTKAVYYSHNINSGQMSAVEEEEEEEIVTLRTAAYDEVLDLIARVKDLCREHACELRKEVLFHPVLQQEVDKPTNGSVAQKHIRQQASLIGHMQRLGHLADDNCYIEFGAGKGGLSHWVQLATSDCKNTRYILVDRGSIRYKMDSYHRGEHQGPSFERLKIDISHLDLGKVPSLQGRNNRIIGMGKHLCGAATDLMLRCLLDSTSDNRTQSPELPTKRPLLGVVLALCCHHRCEWRSYVGRDFMQDSNITSRQFQLMCRLSSWAVCGTRTDMPDDKDNDADHKEDSEECFSRFSTIPASEREAIGHQCKQLLNLGRVRWLQKRGFMAETLCYIDSCYSLENVALLATAKSDSVAISQADSV